MAIIDKRDYESQAHSQSDLNPYKGLNPLKGLTRWQEFLDSVGIGSYGRRAQYEQDLASNQWESQYALSLDDREFNDYLSQVQRMRASGINPDFQDVSAGESSLASNQAGALAPPGLPANHPLGGVFADLLSGLSTALSVYNGVLDIQRKSEDNLNELLKPFIEEANNMSLEQFMEDYRSNDPSKIVPALKFDFSGMSRLQQKKANQRMTQYMGSSAHESAILERANKVLAQKEDNLTKQSSFANDDPVGFQKIMKIISRNATKLMESEQYQRISKARYETKGFDYGLAHDSYRHQYDIQANEAFASEKRGEMLSKSVQEQELDLDLKRWQAQVRNSKIKMCEEMLRDKNPFVKLQGLSLFNTLYGTPSPRESLGGLINSVVPLSTAAKGF